MRLVVSSIKIEPAVKLETKHIAIGEVSMTLIMLIVFLCLGKFDYTVVLGSLLGGGYAVLNFFLMAMSVQRSVHKETPEQAKLVVQNSYTKRLLVLVVVVIIGIKVPYFHWVAVVLPQFFPRITIFIKTLPIFQRKGEE